MALNIKEGNRMKKVQRKLLGVIAAITVFVLLFSSVYCQAVSYQYNKFDVAVSAPEAYIPTAHIQSSDVGERVSFMPTDFCMDSAKELHMLDQENGCVYVFNSKLEYLRKVIFTENGEEVFLAELNGISVKRDGDKITYIIADTDNKRVFFADGNGVITREITRPENGAFKDINSFAPLKVGMDSSDNLYVLVNSVYQGVCVFSAKDDYEFITFLGGNTVESTVTVLADYFWKSIFNKTQIASMRRYIPVSVANFCIDNKDNLYTVTNKSASGTNFPNEIKRFNANNINTLKEQDWGDAELAIGDNYLYIDTSYVDITANGKGLHAALDANLCRVAVFTTQGERLFTFGERNQVSGSFDTPVAIEMLDDNIYVLDQHRQSITMFSPNEYGRMVLDAAKLHTEGKYDEAAPIWKQISERDGANLLAHIGLGKQYLDEGDYKKAMQAFRNGNDRESYSYAFALQRSVEMQKIFPIIAVVALTAFVLLLVLDYKLKNRSKKFVDESKFSIAGKIRFTLFHPCAGSAQIARNTDPKKTIWVAVGIIGAWFIASVCKWCFSGFIFNENELVDFNVWLEIGKTAGLFLLWVVSAWLVTNLMDSSARMTDIIVVTAVSLIPYIIGLVSYTILSNILTVEEGSYLLVLQVAVLLWSFAILWGGMREINEMSFKTSLLCMIFIVLGMTLIIFMAILLWSLLQQVVSFASQIFTEIRKMLY